MKEFALRSLKGLGNKDLVVRAAYAWLDLTLCVPLTQFCLRQEALKIEAKKPSPIQEAKNSEKVWKEALSALSTGRTKALRLAEEVAQLQTKLESRKTALEEQKKQVALLNVAAN